MSEFAPEFGEVGSWTRLPDGNVGQVWAVYADKQRTRRVWIADGERYVDVGLDELVDPSAEPDVDEQGDLFDLFGTHEETSS